MNIELSERGRELGKELQPGEFVMFCPCCDFVAPKNAAGVPICPRCYPQTGLHVVREK